MYFDFLKKIIANNWTYTNPQFKKLELMQFTFSNVYVKVIDGEPLFIPVLTERVNSFGEVIEARDDKGRLLPLDKGVILFENENDKYPLADVRRLSKEIDKLQAIRSKRDEFLVSPWVIQGDYQSPADLRELKTKIKEGACLFVNNNFNELEIKKIDLSFPEVDFQKKIKEIKSEIKELLGFDFLDYEKKERLITSEGAVNDDWTSSIYDIYLTHRVNFCKRLQEKGVDVDLILPEAENEEKEFSKVNENDNSFKTED